MVDIAYIQRKLSALANDGQRLIGESIVQVRSEAARAVRPGSGNKLELGYRETLERMARFIIDIRGNREDQALQALRSAAGDLASNLLEQHATALFGSPSFERGADAKRVEGIPAMRGKLDAITASVAEDARYGIIGHARYEPAEREQAMSISANNSNLVIGSPRANVQQGRDGLAQNVPSWNQAELASILTNAKGVADSIGAPAEIRAQIEALEISLKSKCQNPTLIRQCGEFVAGFFRKASDAGAAALGERILDLLPKD